MYGMSKAQEVVTELARVAAQLDLVIPVAIVTEILTASTVPTGYGDEPEATSRLIGTTYERLDAAGEELLANAITDTFVTPEGFYAYSQCGIE